jgi:hypothetical protein
VLWDGAVRPAQTTAHATAQPDIVAELRARVVAVETENSRLWAKAERDAQERAELRRMLNLKQQTLATVMAPRELLAPAGAEPLYTHATTGESLSAGVEMADG